MADPVRFLTALARSLATMALYSSGHPARERAVDRSYTLLRDLQAFDPTPRFSFLGDEVIYGEHVVRELGDWEWAPRLAGAGVQRLEFEADVNREEFEDFLEQVLARFMLAAVDSSEARTSRRAGVKFGSIGIRGSALTEPAPAPQTATVSYSLGEEADMVRWMHAEVSERGGLPLLEAEAVVRSLSVAMHADGGFVLPLLQLKQFDEYTTTHSLNVSVLTMALAEHLGLGARAVRGFGVAGLLHDLGKVRIPLEILNKPGKLSDEERKVMQAHPVEGARIILAGDRELDLAAAVAYEHHMMLNGGGYPTCRGRGCHQASHLVHVCDVYDALRTNRPYRAAWEAARTLEYIEEKAGTEFEPTVARAFVTLMRQAEARGEVTVAEA
jgi:putative nucleotidyltransferase with HDIG domain